LFSDPGDERNGVGVRNRPAGHSLLYDPRDRRPPHYRETGGESLEHGRREDLDRTGMEEEVALRVQPDELLLGNFPEHLHAIAGGAHPGGVLGRRHRAGDPQADSETPQGSRRDLPTFERQHDSHPEDLASGPSGPIGAKSFAIDSERNHRDRREGGCHRADHRPFEGGGEGDDRARSSDGAALEPVPPTVREAVSIVPVARVGGVDERKSAAGEPVRDDRRMRVKDVVSSTLEKPRKLPGKRVLVAHSSMADLVHYVRFVTGGHERFSKVVEDPLDRTVPRRRYRLDPPSDEENPHVLPRSP